MEVSSSGTLNGVNASGGAKCTGKRKITQSTFPAQPMSRTQDAVGRFFADTTIRTTPKGDRGEGQATASWLFTSLGATPSNTITLPAPPVRCDNALPGTSKTGCVMPYIPAMAYAKTGEFPELAAHIEYAQNTLNLPGKYGTTRHLTRQTDKVKIRQNRNATCPPSLPRPPGRSCDEYPMASTWQGGSTGNFSRRMINRWQNEDGRPCAEQVLLVQPHHREGQVSGVAQMIPSRGRRGLPDE
ncbi:hypothetical protein ACIQNG_33615 [Streptomyces sp. NPDC091377]|uniref:NucA/NucB deoxyribonuclease domain-containing protein n=1 Tax=Streptomyces sp. NPDC091377 TaxID=3365995 RepID=UPI0038209BC8